MCMSQGDRDIMAKTVEVMFFQNSYFPSLMIMYTHEYVAKQILEY